MTDVLTLGELAPRAGEHKPLTDIIAVHHEITDISGVPLDSDRTPVPNDIDFEYTACPYKDSPSRFPDGQPHPMPMSGLERQRLISSFPLVRRQLLASRAAFLDLHGYDDTHDLTMDEGLVILGSMQCLPSYAVNRLRKPVPASGVFPQHLIVGANSASGAMGALGATRRAQNEPLPTGGQAVAATEAEGSMIGSKTVCAAPVHMMTGFLELLRRGTEKVKHSGIEMETEGIITLKEFGRLASFGYYYEALLATHEAKYQADRACWPAIDAYNPQKHNPRRAIAAIKKLKQDLQPAIQSYRAISMHLNQELGRNPFDPSEFADVYTDNILALMSIKVAREKGLDVS